MNNGKQRNAILSENILGYLEKNGMTQKEAAEKAGLKYTTLNSWVKGISYPKEEHLTKLAEVFDCTYADLTSDHVDSRWGYLSMTEQQILTIYRGNEPFRRVVNLAIEAYHSGNLITFAEILENAQKSRSE